MEKFEPPLLRTDLMCITSRDVDIELISKTCCFVNESNVYFPIFEMPTIDHPLKDGLGSNDDEYFEYVVVNKATTLIINCMARVNHKNILLVGLSNLQKKFLKLEKYWKVNFIEIDSILEISEKLDFLHKRFNGNLSCRKNEIARGLLLSKMNQQLLTIDDSAPSLANIYCDNGEGLILLETKNDVSDIVITNYAFSIRSDIKYLDEIQPQDVENIKDKFNEWKTKGSYGAYLSVINQINKALEGIDLKKYKYVTFFTDGIPYGAFLNSIIPCSHVLRSISVDLFIFNNILYETSDFCFGSTIIFSPNPPDLRAYTKIESDSIYGIFSNKNLYVENLIDNKATVNAFSLYAGYYPYDILHICTHGGEIDGYYVIHEFQDRMGKKHTVEYDEIVGFSPSRGEYVNVVSKKIFRYFDGFPWKSDALEEQRYPDYVFQDMSKAFFNENQDENKDTIIRTKIDGPIKDSCHIRCYDDIHQGQFHALASQSFPFIFNNTCNSWQEFSTQLVANGCRAYIGTLWNIGNETATESALNFYKYAFETYIIIAATKMVNEISADDYQGIYLFCGLHFSTLKKPMGLSKNQIMSELAISLNKWMDKASKERSKELLRNIIDVIKFICIKLTSFYNIPHIPKLLARAARLCNYFEKNKLV